MVVDCCPASRGLDACSPESMSDYLAFLREKLCAHNLSTKGEEKLDYYSALARLVREKLCSLLSGYVKLP